MSRGKGIYKRGSIWWIRYADVNGEIRAESSGSTKYEMANWLLCEKRKEVQDGKEHNIKKIYTFSDLCDVYEKRYSDSKQLGAKKYFIKTMREHLGYLELKQFNTKMVAEYQVALMNSKKVPSTVNRHIACLKHMFTVAVDYEMVNDEVLRKIRRVKQLPERNQRTRFLSKEEIKQLIDSCTDDIKPVVILALNTGMRKSEILGLQWTKNVDLIHSRISLTQTKNYTRRDIPINDAVKNTLSGLVRRIDVPQVFIRSSGQPYKTINKRWEEVRAKAGLDDVHFHDLRHTFASHLVMAGIDIMTVKELLGHKSLTMTMRYAHLSPSVKVRAVEVLDMEIGSRPSVQSGVHVGGLQFERGMIKY